MKSRLLLLTIMLSGLVPFSCCREERLPNIQIDDIILTLRSYPRERFIREGEIVHTDTVEIGITFDSRFIAESHESPVIQNSLFAMRCNDPGENGLADKVKSVKISSYYQFNEIPTDSSLNQYFKFRSVDYLNGVPDQPMNELIDLLNTGYCYFFDYPIFFVIDSKPLNNEQQKFKFEIIFESGRSIIKESPEFYWVK